MKRRFEIEKARAVLEETDPGMPDGFEIEAVAWAPSIRAYVVKWSDPAEAELYCEGEKPRPSYQFSAVWFNDDPAGGDPLPASEMLSEKDVQALSKDKGVEVLDAAR